MADNSAIEVLNGTDLILMVENATQDGWQQIAHATSHSIDLTRETREVTSKSTGEWNLKDYAKISWAGSAEGLVTFESGIVNYNELVAKQIAREKIKIISILNDATIETPLDDTLDTYDPTDTVSAAINPFKDGTTYYEGLAVITSISLTAAEGENVTFSLSFEGASALTQNTVASVV